MALLSDKFKLKPQLSGADIKSLYEVEPNAFTDTDKTKLIGIESGAEVNVNADWNAVSGDAQILNKPSLDFEPADPTILKDADIGVTVQSYSANTVIDVDYSTVKATALSATQPGDLSTVATTGAYSDLSGLPTLGTAAATASTDYATAAQGTLADTALQPSDIGGNLTATTFTSTQTTGTAPLTVSSTTVVNNLNADLLDGLNSSAFVQTASGNQVINTINIGLGGGNVSNNTAVGASALNSNTTGVQNTAFGYRALTSNTTGNENTAIGRECLYFNTNGGQNTAIGNATLYRNTSGVHNTGVGLQALTTNTTGSYNVGVGNSSLANNINGSYNVGVGRSSGAAIHYGSNNVSIGYLSGRYSGRVIAVTGTTAGKGYYIHTVGDTDFTLIGAANNNVGTFFVATGAGSGTGTVAQMSSNNVFVGSLSAQNLENGNNNIVIGQNTTVSSANIDDEITLGNSFNNRFRIPGLSIDWTSTVKPPTVVSVPSTASSSGTTGQIAFDSSYFYCCVATDTWVRAALATW